MTRRNLVKGAAVGTLALSLGQGVGNGARAAEAKKEDLLFEWPDDPAERAKLRKLFYWETDDRRIQDWMKQAEAKREELDEEIIDEYDFLGYDDRFSKTSDKDRDRAICARFLEQDLWTKYFVKDEKRWKGTLKPHVDVERKSVVAERMALEDIPGWKLIVPSGVPCSPEMEALYAKFGDVGHRIPNTSVNVMLGQLQNESDDTLSNYYLSCWDPETKYRPIGDYPNPHGFFESGVYSKSISWDDVVKAGDTIEKTVLRGMDRVATTKAK